MATPRIPNQRKQYDKLNERLARYVLAVQSIYDDLNKRAAQLGMQSCFDGEGEFKWSDFPELRRKIEELQTDFVTDLGALIMRGTSEEWKNSNLLQDMIADKVIKTYTGTKDRKAHTQYYQTNNAQLRAFQQRKDRGMNLSAKLWDQSEEYKSEIEDVLSVAIERGTDAITLSKRISKYLQDFPSFQNDYSAKYGKATKVHDCEYRSIRLARSEINMAYRTAEQTRWRQFDFVVGYEIKLSGAHPKEDICDRLAGKYPKDFVWTGWHPNDICYCIPLLKTEDEFFAEDDTPSANEVTDVPPQFKEWCTENWSRIAAAEKNKTLPYFLRDNKEYYQKELNIQKAADLRHRTRDAEAIQLAWDNRQALKERYSYSIPHLRRQAAYWGNDVSELDEYLYYGKLHLDDGEDDRLDEIMANIAAKNYDARDMACKRFDMVRELRKILNDAEGDYHFDDIIVELDNYLKAHKPNSGELIYGSRYNPTKLDDINEFIRMQRQRIVKRRDVLHSINESSIASRLGVEKMEPMSFEEANELRANPLFVTKRREYNVNCQSCVVANELRRRGYDVEALPNYEISGSYQVRLGMDTKIIWIDPKTGCQPVADRVYLNGVEDINLAATIKSRIKTQGRYHVTVVWKNNDTDGKRCGHVFTIERKHNGTIFAYDPQTGELDEYLLQRYLLEIDRTRPVVIYRVDNCDVQAQYIDKVVKKK